MKQLHARLLPLIVCSLDTRYQAEGRAVPGLMRALNQSLLNDIIANWRMRLKPTGQVELAVMGEIPWESAASGLGASRPTQLAG